MQMRNLAFRGLRLPRLGAMMRSGVFTTVPATLTDDNVTITPSKYDIELTTDGVKITSSSNIAVVFTTDGLQIQEPA